MLEADGSFYLNWKLNKNDLPIGITYYLYISQKQNYSRRVDSTVNISNFSYMEDIAKLFNSKVMSIERERTTGIEKVYVVRTDKKESKVLMFQYLNKFPLFGYKSFAQINLYKVHNLVVNREYKRLEYKSVLEEYSINMKKDMRNTEFTHLENLYKN